MENTKANLKGDSKDILNLRSDFKTTITCYAELLHTAELMTKVCSEKPLNINKFERIQTILSEQFRFIAYLEQSSS